MHISRDVSSISIANALSKAPLSKDSIEEWFSKSINNLESVYSKLRSFDNVWLINLFFVFDLTKIQAKFKQCNIGGFQLEFVSISWVISHMTCYNFECSHWWKIYLKRILYKICSPV